MDFTTLHLIAMFLTMTVVAYADHMGFKYFTGKSQTLDLKKVKLAHNLVFIGIGLLVVTGIIITIPMWTYMFVNPFFYTKLAFVLTLVLNGLFIGKLMTKATNTPFALLDKEEKRVLLVSGAVSGISWVATILIGFLGL
ncbi:MAG: hypothetical protein RLY43_162 [Bacteroidota bacterium]|jgi:cation transport ATPase